MTFEVHNSTVREGSCGFTLFELVITLTVLAVPYLLLAFLAWVRRRSGRPTPRSTSLPPWTIWLLLGVVLTFGVLRNLPGWAWLSPA